MSKCREAWKAEFGIEFDPSIDLCRIWQAAWNARGKVDAEICKYYVGGGYIDGAKMCAEAIEQEQCK